MTGEPLRELALFAGAGGGILGGHLLGWRTVCAVEIEDYPRRVLLARQRDGMLPRFPIWDDVTTFDGRPWRGRVDVISGGFPCQDISAAGKGAGITGERSGLWSHMARIIGEVRPRYVFVENSPLLVSRGLDTVLSDLAALGYDARWGDVQAADVIWIDGVPEIDQERDRFWLVASRSDANSPWELQQKRAFPDFRRWARDICEAFPEAFSNAECQRPQAQGHSVLDSQTQGDRQTNWTGGGSQGIGSGWWISEPDVGRVAHGVASRVDRLKCIGNGQVPAVAALAWRLLSDNE